jgi:hypothetical protein
VTCHRNEGSFDATLVDEKFQKQQWAEERITAVHITNTHRIAVL